MIKKILAIACVAITATTFLVGCSGDDSANSNSANSASSKTSSKIAVESDTEKARVGTIDKFLNYKSITLNEKVLYFLIDDAQMQYVGFNITDTTGLEAIPAGESVEDIEYTSATGLTAYVTAKNTNTNAVDYTQCKYYSLRLIKGDCSDVQLHLPNKLGWDATVDTIKKTYGTPLSETTDENGYTVLLYGEDSQVQMAGYTLELIVSDTGIEEFTVEFHEVA